MEGTTMHCRNLHHVGTMSAGLIAFLFALSVPGRLLATPETGVDFSQTAETIAITTQSTETPDILSSRRITCPEDGFVVAIANGGLEYSTVTDTSVGTMAISLSRNRTDFAPTHDLRIVGNYINGLYTGIVSIQRVDPCAKGASHMYRFLATRGANATDASMRQPSLILMFFRDRL
jgi:hypothetical protein